jgi:hypothetical protein
MVVVVVVVVVPGIDEMSVILVQLVEYRVRVI